MNLLYNQIWELLFRNQRWKINKPYTLIILDVLYSNKQDGFVKIQRLFFVHGL